MIRISFWYTCKHEKGRMHSQEVKYTGCAPMDEKRYCFCTGKPLEMARKVTSKDLSPALS